MVVADVWGSEQERVPVPALFSKTEKIGKTLEERARFK
jgi:hypothetical protein